MPANKWARCRLGDFDSYEPYGPFRVLVMSPMSDSRKQECEVFDNLPDAVNHWVLHATPILRRGSAVIQDAHGTILLGYNSHKSAVTGYAWWGIRDVYELVAEHKLMNIGEVAVWEIQASGAMSDVLM